MLHRAPEPEMIPLPRSHQIFGLGKTRCYALAKEGKIRMVKVGGRTFVDAASVRAFFASLPPVSLRGAAGS